MHQVIEPEFEIKIGIRDDAIVKIDWNEMLETGRFSDNKQIEDAITRYLLKALTIYLEGNMK